MATPFDAVGKDLVEFAPDAWLAFLGQPRPAEIVHVVDADLSATISTSTDKVIRVDDPEPWLVMIELQANWDGDLPFDLLRRFGMLRHRHRLPVSVAVVLLRPSAEMAAMTGLFDQPDRLGRDWSLPFHVLRVWETPVEQFLRGPLAMAPLAPIAAIDHHAISGVISEIDRRAEMEASQADGDRVRMATWQLLSLRYEFEFIAQLVDQMATLKTIQSPVWQLIGQKVADAAVLAHARESVLGPGTKKFGAPPAEVEARIKAVDSVAELDALRDRVIDVSSWEQLFGGGA